MQFSDGAKMGWIEIDVKKTTNASALKWITKGYENAKELSKNSHSVESIIQRNGMRNRSLEIMILNHDFKRQ